MLTVKEMRRLTKSLDLKGFKAQVGPFALVQRPPDVGIQGDTDLMGLPQNAQVTRMAKKDKVSSGALGLLMQFEELSVTTLPPVTGSTSLTVGRQPDCDLVLDHSSVSKQHAVIKWYEKHHRCTITDGGSTNGTFLNASIRVQKETVLKDGDILSFGEVQFWYLLTETLHARLSQGGGSAPRGV
jgi:predicted component of type VI protein secretion system